MTNFVTTPVVTFAEIGLQIVLAMVLMTIHTRRRAARIVPSSAVQPARRNRRPRASQQRRASSASKNREIVASL